MTTSQEALATLSPEARDFFVEHLSGDPITSKMIERLEPAVDPLTSAGLQKVIPAAMFRRAPALLGVSLAGDLPFSLGESTARIIDGSRSRRAMRSHADGAEIRQAAALLNALRRVAEKKECYRWTTTELSRSALPLHLQLSFQIWDSELSRLPQTLASELPFSLWLSSHQHKRTGERHQLLRIARVAVFWSEEGQIHCGLAGRDIQGWLEVARFALRCEYPVHRGFLGTPLPQMELNHNIALLEALR